jgi:hypothetical protein
VRVSSIVSSLLLAASLAGCGGAHVHLDAQVAKRLAVAKEAKTPSYWLGTSYDGLRLVHVESGSDAFFVSSLWYADCSWFDMNTLSLRCNRTIELDNDSPAEGEISSMGRCVFTTEIHGVTVATFPVNPTDIRVFSRGATVMVAAQNRAASLRAIAALRPLNGRPLRHRDVSAVLGTCRARPRANGPRLTAAQRYDRRMKLAFWAARIHLDIRYLSPATAAKPKLVLAAFLGNTAQTPALLRNVADRVDKIAAPQDAAGVQAQLTADLRRSADTVDEVRAEAKADGLDERAWRADERELQPRLTADAAAVQQTLAAFRARGYSTYVKPSD